MVRKPEHVPQLTITEECQALTQQKQTEGICQHRANASSTDEMANSGEKPKTLPKIDPTGYSKIRTL